MKENLKTNKGITLIALIVTIVVLLILAIVSINLAINEGFIFKTKDATIKHKVAEIDERLKLEVNGEQIVRRTEKERYENVGNQVTVVWDNSPYMNLIEGRIKEVYVKEFPSVKKGNLYDNSTGKIIAKSLYWLPTDVIMPYKAKLEMFPPEEVEGITQEQLDQQILAITREFFKVEPLNIDINIGERGSFIKSYMDAILSGSQEFNFIIPDKDIFVVDKDYNVYYIDEEGNVITPKRKYKADEILIGYKPLKPEELPEEMPQEDKNSYVGIYNGALAFTGDEKYATYLAENDVDEATTFSTFMFNGFASTTIKNTDGTTAELNGKKLENLATLLTRPDWTKVSLVDDKSKVNYCMDSQYNMYVITENYDKTKTIMDISGAKLTYTDDMAETADNSKTIESGYEYTERFDKRDVLITKVPDKEILDMKTDLAGFNVYGLSIGILRDKIAKTVILPDTLKSLSSLPTNRTMTGTFNGTFEDAANLEYIEIPNRIRKVYSYAFRDCPNLKTVIMSDNVDEIAINAFAGCDGVTVKFKDGKAPAGAPWGGTNINITSK